MSKYTKIVSATSEANRADVSKSLKTSIHKHTGFGYIEDPSKTMSIHPAKAAGYSPEVIALAEQLKYQGEQGSQRNPQRFEDEFYLEYAQRKKNTSFNAKFQNIYGGTDVAPDPEYAQYSYEEILAMANNGVNIPKNVIGWAKGQQEADITDYVVISENSDEYSQDTNSEESELNKIRAQVKDNTVKSKKAQEIIKNSVDNSKNFITTAQNIAQKQKNILANNSIDKTEEMANEWKALDKKKKEEGLSSSEEATYKKLSKKLEKNGNIIKELDKNSSELDNFLSSIDELNTETLSGLSIAQDTITSANNLAGNDSNINIFYKAHAYRAAATNSSTLEDTLNNIDDAQLAFIGEKIAHDLENLSNETIDDINNGTTQDTVTFANEYINKAIYIKNILDIDTENGIQETDNNQDEEIENDQESNENIDNTTQETAENNTPESNQKTNNIGNTQDENETINSENNADVNNNNNPEEIENTNILVDSSESNTENIAMSRSMNLDFESPDENVAMTRSMGTDFESYYEDTVMSSPIETDLESTDTNEEIDENTNSTEVVADNNTELKSEENESEINPENIQTTNDISENNSQNTNIVSPVSPAEPENEGEEAIEVANSRRTTNFDDDENTPEEIETDTDNNAQTRLLNTDEESQNVQDTVETNINNPEIVSPTTEINNKNSEESDTNNQIDNSENEDVDTETVTSNSGARRASRTSTPSDTANDTDESEEEISSTTPSPEAVTTGHRANQNIPNISETELNEEVRKGVVMGKQPEYVAFSYINSMFARPGSYYTEDEFSVDNANETNKADQNVNNETNQDDKNNINPQDALKDEFGSNYDFAAAFVGLEIAAMIGLGPTAFAMQLIAWGLVVGASVADLLNKKGIVDKSSEVAGNEVKKSSDYIQNIESQTSKILAEHEKNMAQAKALSNDYKALNDDSINYQFEMAKAQSTLIEAGRMNPEDIPEVEDPNMGAKNAIRGNISKLSAKDSQAIQAMNSPIANSEKLNTQAKKSIGDFSGLNDKLIDRNNNNNLVGDLIIGDVAIAQGLITAYMAVLACMGIFSAPLLAAWALTLVKSIALAATGVAAKVVSNKVDDNIDANNQQVSTAIKDLADDDKKRLDLRKALAKAGLDKMGNLPPEQENKNEVQDQKQNDNNQDENNQGEENNTRAIDNIPTFPTTSENDIRSGFSNSSFNAAIDINNPNDIKIAKEYAIKYTNIINQANENSRAAASTNTNASAKTDTTDKTDVKLSRFNKSGAIDSKKKAQKVNEASSIDNRRKRK